MVEYRDFHIADLVTVVDGRLLSPSGIGAVYEVIDFVTGQPHMTHQIPRACETVKPELLRQHPWLTDVEIWDGIDSVDEVNAWALRVADIFGEMHSVAPLPPGAYVNRDPIAELIEMAPHMDIIAVEAGQET